MCLLCRETSMVQLPSFAVDDVTNLVVVRYLSEIECKRESHVHTYSNSVVTPRTRTGLDRVTNMDATAMTC